MRAQLLAVIGAALLALPAASDAASLRLSDGATMAIGGAVVPFQQQSAQAHAPAALTYSFVDGQGRTWSGTVPGSEGGLSREVALAQNPLTRDILLAFVRPGQGGHDVAATLWTGQSWTEPQALAATHGDDRTPLLAFRAGGDALIAWTSHRVGTGASVLLRHVEVGTSEARTYSFTDIGTISQLRAASAPGSSAEPRLLGLVGGTESLSAYLLVGTPDGSPLAAVKVGLDAIIDGGGFGAAPVPVSWIRTTTQSAGTGGILTGRAGETGVQGEVLAPWRLLLGRSDAWYWSEGARVQLALRPEGQGIRLVAFADPGAEALLHVEAYRIARLELGVQPRRPGMLDGALIIRRER